MIARALLLALLAFPAGAQEAVVTPPAIPALPEGEADHLLRMIAHARVAQGNCPGQTQTAAPFLLLAGAEDALVARMALDGAALDRVYAPVIAALAKPGFCAAEVPRIAPLLDMLVFWGGSLSLIRD